MDLEEIKEQIDELEPKVKNPKKYFNEAVLDEMEDHFYESETYFFIEDMDYYLYWINIAIDLNNVLKSLLELRINGNDKIDKYLIKCIDLKIVVDKNLIKYNQENCKKIDNRILNDIEKDIEEEINVRNKKEVTRFEIKGEEQEKEEIINGLYHLLREQWRAIDISLEGFKAHFIHNSFEISPIKWNRKQETLLALFQDLFNKSFIINNVDTNGEKCDLISSHFLSKFGRPLNVISLKNTYSNASLDKNLKKHLNNFVAKFTNKL